MTTQEMLNIIRSQLTTDLNCTPDDLNGETDSFVFTEVRNNPGRRPFPRGERHFEMYSMGTSVVVSASPDILEIVKPLLEGKTRDEAFNMSFVEGQGINFLPDLARITPINPPDGFDYETVERDEIPALYRHEGFHYALQYDEDHPRPDVLAVTAKKDGSIIGIAGASDDCAKIWQIGVNVLPGFRNYGLAKYLVNRLTLDILKRGYVPHYATATSNIISQRVAFYAGYYPSYVCAYKGRFEGMECMPSS